MYNSVHHSKLTNKTTHRNLFRIESCIDIEPDYVIIERNYSCDHNLAYDMHVSVDIKESPNGYEDKNNFGFPQQEEMGPRSSSRERHTGKYLDRYLVGQSSLTHSSKELDAFTSILMSHVAIVLIVKHLSCILLMVSLN